MRLTIRLQKLQGEGGGAEEKSGWSPTHELALAMIKKKVKNNNENKLEIG